MRIQARYDLTSIVALSMGKRKVQRPEKNRIDLNINSILNSLMQSSYYVYVYCTMSYAYYNIRFNLYYNIKSRWNLGMEKMYVFNIMLRTVTHTEFQNYKITDDSL